MSRMTREGRVVLLTPALLVIAALVGAPLLIMMWISFLGRGNTAGVEWASSPSLANYFKLVWEEDFDGSLIFNTSYIVIFLRSVAQALVTTLVCILLGLPVALWMSSLPRKARNLMVFLITIPFWTNLLVRNYAWLILLREDGAISHLVNAVWPSGRVTLLYNDVAVAIGLVYSFLPFLILPVYSVFEKFDWRLLEAAYDLGASRSRAFRKVILPLAMPGLIAGALLVFIPSLGAFVTPALLGGGKTLMIGNLIQMQFGSSRNWPFGAALSVVLLAGMMLSLMALAFARSRRRA